MKIESVCIVGGGSSGWMTAAALSKLCPNLEIALIESPTVKTVGVGESTLGHINRFLDLLDLKDEDWMAECNATYKNSIRFTNFRENDGTHFEYPFASGFDYTDKYAGLLTWADLAVLYPDEYTPETFAEFYATGNTFLAKYNKECKNADGVFRNFDFKYDTAYHMDAEKFGQYLKNKIAIPNGVQYLVGNVCKYQIDETTKNITTIVTEDDLAISADLFIDCTGFKSLLLEGFMGSRFQSFSNMLANNKAMACRLPYVDREEEMENVTNCTAIENGWVWNIPLWNRIGTGYVYSSKFVEKEVAEKEFRAHLARDPRFEKRAEEAQLFHIDIKHGKRARAWVNNVVGVGLSYAFVEPLESTGLLTTHENIIKLIETLNRRDGYVSRMDIDGFNFACDYEMNGWQQFIAVHYGMSMRTDTPYWRWCTQVNEYIPDIFDGVLREPRGIQNFYFQSNVSRAWNEDLQGVNYIAAGMGLKPHATKEVVMNSMRRSGLKEDVVADTKRKYEQYRDYVIDYVNKLPSHYEYLRDNIYGGIDEYI